MAVAHSIAAHSIIDRSAPRVASIKSVDNHYNKSGKCKNCDDSHGDITIARVGNEQGYISHLMETYAFSCDTASITLTIV